MCICLFVYMILSNMCMSIVHNIHICLWGIGRMYTHLKYIILSDLSASQGSMEVVGRGEFSPPGSSVCCHSSLRCWFKSSLLVESTSLTPTTWLNHVSPNFLFIVPAGLGKRKTPAGRDRTMRVSASVLGLFRSPIDVGAQYCLGAVQRCGMLWDYVNP